MSSIFFAQLGVAFFQFCLKHKALFRVHESLCNHRILSSILHPHHNSTIDRGYFQCHVHLRRCSAAHHDRNLQSCVFKLSSHIDHLLKTRCDKTAQSNHVNILFNGLLQYLLGGHHHSEVNHLVVVARHHHINNILAYVVNVALYGCHKHLTRRRAAFLLVCLNVGLQYCHSLLHGACCLHHLWQEHLAATEQLAHLVHTVHQRPLNDVHRLRIDSKGFLDILLHIVGNSLLQGCSETCGNVSLTPFGFGSSLCCANTCRHSVLQSLLLLLYLVGKFHKTFRSVLLSVEHYLFNNLQLICRYFVVGNLCCGVYNAEVHTLANCVVEKHRVHCLTNIIVATEREREVAHATAHMRSWQICLNPFDSPNEVYSIIPSSSIPVAMAST